MIFESMLLSIIVGFIRRGKLTNLAHIPLRRIYLFAVPLALYAVAYLLMRTTNDHILLLCTRATNILQYVVLLAAIGVNLHIREMRLMGLGTFLNFLALSVNGGVMPVHPRAVELAGMTAMFDAQRGTELVRHLIMTPETRLKLLIDIIPLPGYGPHLPEVASIGDVLLAIGIFVLVQRYMCSPRSWSKAKE